MREDVASAFSAAEAASAGMGGRVWGVAHMAARSGAGPSVAAPEEYVAANVTGTALLLEASHRHGVKSFVYASSSSVYGDLPKGTPFVETMEPKPISPYAASKVRVRVCVCACVCACVRVRVCSR